MQAEIRARIVGWAKAVRARNLDGVMSFYGSDLVSFDVDPPQRYVGTANQRRAWAEFFAVHRGAVGYDVTNLNVSTQGDVAFVRSLNRVTGTLPSGNTSEMWVRWMACFRRFDGVWLIVHDHISVPVGTREGRAALNLAR